MAKKDKIASILEKARGLLAKEYEEARADEGEELHNAIVELITEHNVPIEKAIGALSVVLFQLQMAKYKEIMGVVKLTEKPPLKKK